MNLILDCNNMNDYLQKTSFVDYDHYSIQFLANKLKKESHSQIECISKAYEYVRDQIAHSADVMENQITFKASEVLEAKHGICFAKSNLLAALLRCLKVPTGFCYQRLILDDKKYPYLVLHGLNGVYIEELGKWIRLDARGNKPEVCAHFSLYEEKLAFPVRKDLGEEDIPIIFSNPNQNVIDALIFYETRQELWNHIPQNL